MLPVPYVKKFATYVQILLVQLLLLMREVQSRRCRTTTWCLYSQDQHVTATILGT